MATQLRVNGEVREVQADGENVLLYALRNDLGLTGAKHACGQEQCGACTVLLDGEPRRACRVSVREAAGHAITTVEGLGGAAAPHPLQRAFLAENAAQCGYCAPGILISAAALLARERAPTDASIRHALREHLCRCGAHNRIVRAVQRAAAQASEQDP